MKMIHMDPAVKKQFERDTLRSVIQQWNANRLDLFEISEPNEDNEFHGVMRFYFQDSGQKVATKCIRVASDATTQAVIETLIEKFHADMRMLSIPEYALYEIHENGDERKLSLDEKPLLVQLNWHIDDREGRFLLKRIDNQTCIPAVGFRQDSASSFRRKLSKREKKQMKKQEKLNRLKAGVQSVETDGSVTEMLYTELPETSFTRSISNPEAVMRRRRAQKLEKKLQQFQSKDGGPDTGGTLKIYGESLCREVPYKTLLLSVCDTAHQVVKEMLSKYGLEKEIDPHNYCLVQVNANAADAGENEEYPGGINSREYILDDDECPLAILMNHPSHSSIMFHVRRRPADYHPRKKKKKPQQKYSQTNELVQNYYDKGLDRLPFFLELNPDGTDIINVYQKKYIVHPNVTEVGSERPDYTDSSLHGHQTQSLQLTGSGIQHRHCVIAYTEGIVTVTPCSTTAETYVNGQRVYETTILQNGVVVQFGKANVYRFYHLCSNGENSPYDEQPIADYNYNRRSSHQGSIDHNGSTAHGQIASLGISSNKDITNNSNPATSPQNYETTFDVEGNVETISVSSLGNKEETRSQRSIGSSQGNNKISNDRYFRGTEPILPAVLEFREETEEAFLHAVITDLDPMTPQFKLAPTYTLYLVARYRASTHYRPELTPTERAHRLTLLLVKVARLILTVIQEKYAEEKCLSFWMANASELLHFLKSDRHISAFSLDAQDILAECVQLAFRNLVSRLQGDVAAVMPQFMSETEDTFEEESTRPILEVLTSAMTLLRCCRANAALTIQLFSQLFHFVNMWIFNKIVSPVTQHSEIQLTCYCTREWGTRLKARLSRLQEWAERQGLELAADCHLARIAQATHLLQATKYNAEDLAALSSACFKLNSLQLRALLSKYQPASDELRIPPEIIENVVRVAENVADELARSDGREVRLEEERELHLPFLLPEDGYSCDVVRGVPQGLAEFLVPLQEAGLCRLTSQPASSGLWSIYMTTDHKQSITAMGKRFDGFHTLAQTEPEVQVIKLNKSSSGMGLSIVAAKGAGQDQLGIYIKSVVKGGAADANGQLEAGDQLLSVDGQSLVGITQEKAAEYLVRTGPIVTLEVAKQGAIYNGLATLLQQPSPVMGKGPRELSDHDLQSRGFNENIQRDDIRKNIASIHSSKSVPSLNTGNDAGDQGPLSPTSLSANKILHETYERQQHVLSNAGLSGIKSRSSRNINDSCLGTVLPPTGLRTKQISNSNLQQSVNLGLTLSHPNILNQQSQQQQKVSQNSYGHSSSQIHHYPTPPGHPHYAMNKSSVSNLPQKSDGEQFYQNLNLYHNQDSSTNVPYAVSQSRKSIQSSPISEERNTLLQQNGLRNSRSSLHSPIDRPVWNTHKRPASAYILQKDQIYNAQQVSNMMPRSLSSKDIVKQEAQFNEIRKGIQNKELREHAPLQYHSSHPRLQSQIPTSHQAVRMTNLNYLQSNQNVTNFPGRLTQTYSVDSLQNSFTNASQCRPRFQTSYGPPTAPKPLRPSQESMRFQLSDCTETRMLSDTVGHVDSSASTTHPLCHSIQKQPQETNVKYTAGMTNTPRSGYSLASTDSDSRYQLNARNPWNRDEREKEEHYRREASRVWREEQIAELSALTQRTSQQEEQLRALKLEHEFQRRADEADCQEEEEDEEAETNQDFVARSEGPLQTIPKHNSETEHAHSSISNIQSSTFLSSQENSVTKNVPLSSPVSLVDKSKITAGNTDIDNVKKTEDERFIRSTVLRREKDLKLHQHQQNIFLQQQQQLLYQQQQPQHRQMQQQKMFQQQQGGNHTLNDERNKFQFACVESSYLHPVVKPDTRLNRDYDYTKSPNRTQSTPHTSGNSKVTNPNDLHLENLILSKPTSPHHLSQQAVVHPQYNSYLSPQTSVGCSLTNSFQDQSKTQNLSAAQISNSYNRHQDMNHPELSSPALHQQSSTQRLDYLLSQGDSVSSATMTSSPPQPPERDSSFAVTQGVHRNVFENSPSSNMLKTSESQTPNTSVTARRISFPNIALNQQSPQFLDTLPAKEDPNHFIDEAKTLLASPKSPDGPFSSNTPGVIGAQEVYKDPRTRLLAHQQQQKQLADCTGTLPEKLSFKEKIKMFAMETG